MINNKTDGDNKPIAKQHHWWFVIFFRSTVQMTSDGTNKEEEENQKRKLAPALFSLESHNDPLTFLSVSFLCLLFIF